MRMGSILPCLFLALFCLLRFTQAELKIAILMQGSDFINVSIVPVYDVDQYDLGDVYISPCRMGTYNEARDSYCKDCSVCSSNQYLAQTCIPTQNSLCLNCTVCTDQDQETCSCGQRSGDCTTGNRVCTPLPATSINITFDLTVGSQLSPLKERFLQEGMRTGFILYLSSFLQHSTDDILLLYLTKKPSGTSYLATYVVNNVYSLYTKAQVTKITQTVVQEGLISTFGIQSNTFNTVTRRRRLLQSNTLTIIDLRAGNVEAGCIILGQCGPFFVMLHPESPCLSSCEAIPCPPGYTGMYGKCDKCQNATFKSTHGNETCTPCSSGFTSDQGSTDITQCIPVPTTSTTATPVSTAIITTATTSVAASTTGGKSVSTPPATTLVIPVDTTRTLTGTTTVTSIPSSSTSVATTASPTSEPATTSSSVKLTVQTSSSSSITPVPPPNPASTTSGAPPYPPYYYYPYPGTGGGAVVNNQYVTVNGGGGDTPMIVVSIGMVIAFFILGCIGARLFFFPIRSGNSGGDGGKYYYYYYKKIKDEREILIPIVRRQEPVVQPDPAPVVIVPTPTNPPPVVIPPPTIPIPVVIPPPKTPDTPWAPLPRHPSPKPVPLPSNPSPKPVPPPPSKPSPKPEPAPSNKRPEDQNVVYRVPVQHLGTRSRDHLHQN